MGKVTVWVELHDFGQNVAAAARWAPSPELMSTCLVNPSLPPLTHTAPHLASFLHQLASCLFLPQLAPCISVLTLIDYIRFIFYSLVYLSLLVLMIFIGFVSELVHKILLQKFDSGDPMPAIGGGAYFFV